METLELLLLIVFCASAILLTVGIIRPSFSVWWTEDKTRINVLKVWGILAAVTGLGYILLGGFAEDNVKDDSRSQSARIEIVKTA